MNKIEQALFYRDGLSVAEAEFFVREARARVWDGENPEKILKEEFFLEPEYVSDLIGSQSLTAIDE
jgi:hypothetical protein